MLTILVIIEVPGRDVYMDLESPLSGGVALAYRVTVEKTFTGPVFTGEKWTNVYHFNVADADSALSRGTAAGVLEMAVSYEDVMVTGIRVTVPGDPSQSRFTASGSIGLLETTGAGQLLPFFNTVRVVLTDGEGRPEQKYLRLAARDSNLGAGVWDGEFVTYITDNYLSDLLILEGLCGPTDQPITGGLVRAEIQNRQLGWHRRTRPGFKRGWVPV